MRRKPPRPPSVAGMNALDEGPGRCGGPVDSERDSQVDDDEDKLFGKAGRVRPITPTLGPRDQRKLLNALKLEGGAEPNFADALRRLARQWVDDVPSLELRTILLLTADLYEQGWSIRLAADHFMFEPPGLLRGEASIEQVKDRVQRALQVGRERQLREPSVRQFIARMERRSPRAGGAPASIFDVIDDGNALANALAQVRALPEERRDAALKRVVDPVVEYCEAGARCADTGLPLIDIWRYFRHTWSHEYRSIPGRQMMVLIRNAARPNRPVMGIAMLASPVMRLHARDMWIGWLRPAAEARVMSGEWKPRAFVRALTERLERSIADIRWDDLASAEEIAAPSEAVVFRLQQKAYGAAYQREIELRALHGEGAGKGARRDPVRGKDEAIDWRAASEDLLFVRKRAEMLAELLFAKLVFAEFDLKRPTAETLAPMFAAKRGQRAIDIALTELRKAGLSSQVADVSVCGAVHPYNDLLGGKLVALMLTSREVRAAYARRYGGQVSVIASQMAGRPVVKSAQLQVLTTTSLYGLGSSQYNRLVLRGADHWGLPSDIRWQAIGESLTGGYGTLHLGAGTVHALRQLGERQHAARRINNRFGEGTSPRLRQVREGLDALGVQSDRVLHHATPRLFYGCELDEGACASLLATRQRGPARAPSAAAIGAAWRRRWLAARIDHPDLDILERIRPLGAETISASLFVPELEGEDQLELFGGPDSDA